jgi:Fic family protein
MKKEHVPDNPFNALSFLPPKGQIMAKTELWEKEAAARSSLAELKGMAHAIPNQSILLNAITLQEAQDSSEIENIITTRDQVLLGMVGGPQANDLNTKEVLHYREAIFTGHNLIQEKGYLSRGDIDTIQSVLIGNNAGIRKNTGTVLINDKTGKVIYTPPEPAYIPKLLDNLLSFFNTCEPTIMNMAILHYQFESIHPYYDGNGRTGRLLNILFLVSKGLLNAPILYLSSYIMKQKSSYYKYLNQVTFQENWDQWLLYMLSGVEVVAKDTLKKVKDIQEVLAKTIETVKTKRPKIYSKELVETLFENPYCKNEFLVKSIGVERKAAARYLNQLTEIHILEKKKVGKSNIYINLELLKILQR